MNKSLNLQIQEFKEGLAAYINRVNLPVGIKAMIVYELSQSLDQANFTAVEQERANIKKEGEKDGKEIHKT